MTSVYTTFAAGLLAVALTTPSFAQEAADAAKMTCKEYTALDATAMTAAVAALKASPMAIAEMKALSDADAMAKIAKACEGVADKTVMDAMHGKM